MTLSAKPGPCVGTVSPLHPTLNYAGKAALAPTIVLLNLFSLFLYRSAGLQTLAFVFLLFIFFNSFSLLIFNSRAVLVYKPWGGEQEPHRRFVPQFSLSYFFPVSTTNLHKAAPPCIIYSYVF